MREFKSIDQVWEDLRNKDENLRLTINASRKVNDIINKIVEARNSLNISQRDLAEKCGIKQPALARIETLKTIPKINTLIKIAECVNISIEALDEQQKNEITNMKNFAAVVYDFKYRMNTNGGNIYASQC